MEHAMKVVERIFEHRIRQQIVIDDMHDFATLKPALEVFLNDMRYINPRFTYLLTYLPISGNYYTVLLPTPLLQTPHGHLTSFCLTI